MSGIVMVRQSQVKQSWIHIHKHTGVLKQQKEAERRKREVNEVQVRNLTSRPC